MLRGNTCRREGKVRLSGKCDTEQRREVWLHPVTDRVCHMAECLLQGQSCGGFAVLGQGGPREEANSQVFLALPAHRQSGFGHPSCALRCWLLEGASARRQGEGKRGVWAAPQEQLLQCPKVMVPETGSMRSQLPTDGNSPGKNRTHRHTGFLCPRINPCSLGRRACHKRTGEGGGWILPWLSPRAPTVTGQGGGFVGQDPTWF